MAKNFASPIDLHRLEILNALLQNLASAPSSPVESLHYYDSVDKAWKFYDGTAWNRIAEAWLKARANHTGTQTASTISDFDTQVRTSRLDQLAAPTTDVSLNSHKLTNVTDPTSGQDAATKNYVDGAITGLDWKGSTRAATTANITLSGAQTIDGVSVIAGDRVLVKNQTTGANNGIYVAAAGAWARATDADTSAEVTSGMMVPVTEGTDNGNTQWMLTTDDPITLGTTALTFTQFASGTSYSAGTGISISGNTISRDATYVDTVAQGGTNASTAAGARANLGAVGKYSQTYGDGSTTTFTITHSLGTSDLVGVVIRKVSTGAIWDVETLIVDANNISIVHAVAPTTNEFRVSVAG
jgi:hypothetical protein